MGSSTIALAEAVDVEPTFLPEGWEIKVVGTADELDAPAPAAQLISSDERTGEVVAIVGVTGIVDHVNDLIEPGAYSDTLAKRRPKVCWAHSWEQPIGKVLRIEEWAPGDPRLAQVKATLGGQPWPAAAGALVAHMRMNLKSAAGRDAFAAVDFYSDTGECEWSIGWQTVPGATTRRKDGVRVCKKVELYEVSPVLFGAAPLTRTLEVKSLDLLAAHANEGKALWGRRRVEFDEDKHPRDRNGRFIEVGGQVRVWGTQKRGRVTERDGNVFTVRMYGSGEERRIPKGMLLANDDVLVTRMEHLPGSEGWASPVTVGWVDPNDAEAMAAAQSKPVKIPGIYDEATSRAGRRAEARGNRRHERLLAAEAAAAALAEAERREFEERHRVLIETERERLRTARPALRAYEQWEQENADLLAAMDPEDADVARDEQWLALHRGPLGDQQRALLAELGIKSLPLSFDEPADDAVEEIADDDDGINHALLIGEHAMVPGGTYVTRFGSDGESITELKEFELDPEETDDENELHRLAMDEIDWAEVEAAATGEPAPPAADDDRDDDGVTVDVKAMFDLTEGALVDFAALAADLDVKAEGGADRNRGNAEALRRSYVSGKTAAKIRWGTPGDHTRCVKIAGKHMTPDQAHGYCNLRSKEATGHYSGEKESKGLAAAEALAKSWNPMLEVGVDAGHIDRKSMGTGQLRGTFEQRREALDRALADAITPLHPAVTDTPDDQPVPLGGDRGWVSIDGTWDDRVVATFIRYSGGGPEERQTYEVDYEWDGEDVTLLGAPRPVELQVSVVPIANGPELTAEQVEDTLLGPAVLRLDEGIGAIKAALSRSPEVKAGRMLSEANVQRVRGALEHLLEVARAAGIPLPGWTGEDQAPVDADGTPDTTAPGTSAAARGGAPAEVKVLTLADVQADLAGFGDFLR